MLGSDKAGGAEPKPLHSSHPTILPSLWVQPRLGIYLGHKLPSTSPYPPNFQSSNTQMPGNLGAGLDLFFYHQLLSMSPTPFEPVFRIPIFSYKHTT